MKRAYIVLLAVLLGGCRAYYNYYPPTPNTAIFNNGGEVHVAGNLSNEGLLAQGGVAVTDNISLIGSYGGSPYGNSRAGGYVSTDAEFGLGYKINLNSVATSMLCIAGGYGLGNNKYIDSGRALNGFNGSYTKPFFQFTFAKTSEHAEVAFSLKFDYMTYNGNELNSNANGYNSINANTFFYEPYASGNIGGNVLRFTYGLGFAIKRVSDFGNLVHVDPWEFNFGFLVRLNKK